MDELNEDHIRKAMKEYEGISESQNQRSMRVDLCKIASLSFVNHLAQDTQLSRSMYDFCNYLENDIYTEWIDENVHVEFFEGDMTKTEIDDNAPLLKLDRRMFFEEMITGIQMWLDSKDDEDERERKSYNI